MLTSLISNWLCVSVIAFIIFFAVAAFLFSFFKGWKIWERLLFVLAVLLMIFSFSWIFSYQPEFNPSDEEWEEAYYAKELSTPDSGFDLIQRSRRGPLYPVTLYLTGYAVGIESAPKTLNNIAIVLTVIFLWIAIYKLTGKKWLATIGIILLVFNPIWWRWSFLLNGYPALMSCLLSGWAMFLILFIKDKKIPNFIGMISFLSLLQLGKIEYTILVIPTIIAVLASWKTIKRKSAVIMAFIIATIPGIATIFIQRNAETLHYCGSESRVGLVSEGIVNFVKTPPISFVDLFIKTVGGWRLSLTYMIDEIPTVIRFWMASELVVFFSAALLGIFFMIRNKEWKTAGILWLSFLGVVSIYAADCAIYVPRYATPQIVLVTILVAIFINAIWEIKTTKKQSIIKKAAISVIIFMILVSYSFGFVKNINYFYRDADYISIRSIKKIMPHVAEAKLIVTTHRTEAMKIAAIDKGNHRIIALNDLFAGSYKIKEEDDICALTNKGLCDEGTYFIRTTTCSWFVESEIACNKLLGVGELIFDGMKEEKEKIKVFRIISDENR